MPNPGVVTVTSAIAAIRQRCDMVNSQFITDAELIGYIAASHYELYDVLVQKFGNDYFVGTPYEFQTDGVNERYALPDGSTTYHLPDGVTHAPAVYKLLGVDLQLTYTPDGWVSLRPFTFQERNRNVLTNVSTVYGVTNLRYRLNGDYLWFTPMPAGGQTVRIHYVPRLTAVTAGADTIDGVSGWEEYIITDCCIKALAKEESDPSVFMAQKAALLKRIEAAAENRDAGAPATVADTYRNGYFGQGGWYGGSF